MKESDLIHGLRGLPATIPDEAFERQLRKCERLSKEHQKSVREATKAGNRYQETKSALAKAAAELAKMRVRA